MPEPEYPVLQLSPDDVIEIKHGSLRISKLQKAVDQALQKLEPQFVQELDRTLQSMGITPSISGGGTWMITDPSSQIGLPMQYLQMKSEGWSNGLISLSIKIEVRNLTEFIQVRILDFLQQNPVQNQQQLIQFLDLSIRLLKPNLTTSDTNQMIKSTYGKLNVIKNTVSRFQSEEVTEEKVYDLISKSLSVLEGLGCIFPDWNRKDIKKSNLISPLDDIRQQASTPSQAVTDSPLDDIRQSLDQ